MTHSYGYKRRTRHKFQKGFRSHGAIHISKNLTTFKVGDIVDVVVDGAVHKSMPYKYYHGRTGTVFNVNPRAVGVIVNKQVRNRIIPKRLHIRIEHLKLSTCRKEFLNRCKENDRVIIILMIVENRSQQERKENFNKKSRETTKRNFHHRKARYSFAQPQIALRNCMIVYLNIIPLILTIITITSFIKFVIDFVD